MVTINRGYSFETTETVNAAKLHALIDGATISGITADEFDEDVHGITTASPATEAPGDIHFFHEAVDQWELPSSGDTWSQSYYGLRVDASRINVFNPYGLETPKFVHGSDLALLLPGRAILPEANDTAATLRTGEDNTTFVKPYTFGCNSATTVATDSPIRCILIGPCLAETGSAGTDWPWPDLLYDADITPWSTSGATNLSGASLLKLSANTSGTGLRLAYAMGGEIYRN